MNEALMILLLKLDSVKGGIDPTVREARRKVSRRIVGLQEIVDGISDERVVGLDELMIKWEEMVVDMEKEVWEEDGDRDGWTKCEKREMERFCFEKLGFRCMERFLHS
ncbi:BAG family molecular chaperone regulator 5, mitochondrial-like [Thalictrum thalictroides]|uniref:BAG family molecular chaperone regulator 5, mitochondrial-like n=1 Tax=Thalictrum thalictroides TaxID=46969 RepID=A0A7J6W3L1_THATH|nr:BAG family molecular chaperone regulator 5, mitochondrial-like [Thalictrum thalictroides]